MPSRADYSCPDHGTIVADCVFDYTPPPTITSRACEVPTRDKNGSIDDIGECVLNRVWSPVSIGAVKGSGGSPARTSK